MIRSFDLTDLLTVSRLSAQAICFHPRLAATEPLRPVRRALLGRMFPTLHPETCLVTESAEALAFGQFLHRAGSPHAHLSVLAPSNFLSNPRSVDLAEALVSAAGSRNAHYLVAEADTQSDAYAYLRRTGFSVYARQTIWRSEQVPEYPDETPTGSLRPAKPEDQVAITSLFASIVPAMMQQVERAPDIPKGWSLLESGELVGFFQCAIGSRGVWIDPYFHPGARQVSVWLAQFSYAAMKTYRLPVFYCVRSYQDWLDPMMQEMGFSCLEEQSVLARRIVSPVTVSQPLQLPIVEGNAPPVTTITPTASQPSRGV
jgi:hypothetical protein